MSYTARTEYCCSSNTEKEYTSFKWTLPDFSLLKDNYEKIVSSKFVITNTNVKCHLECTLQNKCPMGGFPHTKPARIFGTVPGNDIVVPSRAEDDVYISLHFPSHVEFEKMKVIMSLVDTSGAKGFSLSQRCRSSQVIFNLIDSSVLANPIMRTKFMVNDTVNILCEIINIKDQNSILTDTKTQGEHFGTEIQEKLQIFFDNKNFCDVIFTIGENKLYAHRVILAANSPVFEAMFNTDMAESNERNVIINDIDAATFEAFLKYMYTGSIAKMEDIVSDLLIVADKYQVQSLGNLCENYITDRLDKTNAIDILLLAHLHNFDTLKSKALSFLRSCDQRILNSMEFNKLCIYPDLMSKIFCTSS